MREVLLALVLLAAAGCLGDGDEPAASVEDTEPASLDATTTPSPAPVTWGEPDDALVRPGTFVLTGFIAGNPGTPFPWSREGLCTASFVLTDPSEVRVYVSIAAHCVEDVELGEELELVPGVNATLAYSSFHTMDALGVEDEEMLWQNDLALLEVLAHQRHLIHPSVLHYGGPTGLADQAGPGTLVRTFGNSNWRELTGDTLDPREGIRTTGNEGYHRLQLIGPSVPTDSGSPVMTFDGQALGVMAHLYLFEDDPNQLAALEPDTPASNGATELAWALDYAREHTGTEAVLATAPWLG